LLRSDGLRDFDVIEQENPDSAAAAARSLAPRAESTTW